MKGNKDIFVRILAVVFCFIFSWLKISIAEEIGRPSNEDIMSATLNDLAQKQHSRQREMQVLQSLQLAELETSAQVENIEEKDSPMKLFAEHLHPYLSEEVKSDNNVDAVEEQRKSSIINTVNPGLKYSLRDSKKSITSDINLTSVLYNNRRDANWQKAAASFVLNYKLGKGIATIADNYSNYFEPELRVTGQQQRDNSEQNLNNSADLTRSWTNDFSVAYGRAFNRFGFDAKFLRSDYEVWHADTDSVTENYEFSPYFKLSNKTRILGKYRYQQVEYPHEDAPDNSRSHLIEGTIASAISAKTSVSLTAGNTVTYNKVSSNYTSPTFSGRLGYKISQRSDIAFGYLFSIYDYTIPINSYTINRFSLSGNHRFGFSPKWSFQYGVLANFKDFTKTVQEDKTYLFNLGLSYAFRKWLDFSLQWVHTKFESNIDESYSKDTIAFKTQARF